MKIKNCKYFRCLRNCVNCEGKGVIGYHTCGCEECYHKICIGGISDCMMLYRYDYEDMEAECSSTEDSEAIK